jgi:hypothetical protein
MSTTAVSDGYGLKLYRADDPAAGSTRIALPASRFASPSDTAFATALALYHLLPLRTELVSS